MLMVLFGTERMQATASENAAEFAIKVAEVTTPRWLHSRMARFIPGVRPRSSALMMRRRTPQIYQARLDGSLDIDFDVPLESGDLVSVLALDDCVSLELVAGAQQEGSPEIWE